MFNSEILEVAVGLVFVFLVASLLASALREMIEAVAKTRAIQLERGIRQLLDDPTGTGTTKALFEHPLLYGLFAGGYDPARQLRPFVLPWARQKHRMGGADAVEPRRLQLGSNMPAYVPSRNFALALMHEVGVDGGGLLTLESLKANAMTLRPGRVREAMLAAVSEAGEDLDRARTSVEAWFDSNMDRVSGWYKRETQYVLFGLGVVIAIALNINVFSVAQDLARNNSLRLATVVQAEKTIADIKSVSRPPAPPGGPMLDERELREKLAGLSSLIGWERFEKDVTTAEMNGWWGWPLFVFWVIGGWLLTAVAVSLGAPFWFDLLNKFMIIRSTVKPYEKSPAEGPVGRSAGAPAAEKLAPPPEAGAGTGPEPPRPAVAGPAVVTLRLAVDLQGLEPGSLVLTVDDQPLTVPPDGFVEAPLTVDAPHTLTATARRGHKAVAWSEVVVPHLNSEAAPLEAALA